MHLHRSADTDPEIIYFRVAARTTDGEFFSGLIDKVKPVAHTGADAVLKSSMHRNTCFTPAEISGQLRIDGNKKIIHIVGSVRLIAACR